jgi:hypothetical protein
LPSPRCCAAAFWDGRFIRILGGFDGEDQAGLEIFRLDPRTLKLELRATSPLPIGSVSTTFVAWNGIHAFVFGGSTNCSQKEILRYAPRTEQAQVVGLAPGVMCDTSAAWDGCHAYLFGAQYRTQDVGDLADAVLRYDVETGTAQVVARLPSARDEVATVYVAPKFYAIGGTEPVHLDEVVSYEPDVACTNPLPPMTREAWPEELAEEPRPANQPPSLPAVAEVHAAPGYLVRIVLPTGTDPEGDPLTYNATKLPYGATFDAATREFTWTPQEAGRVCFTYRVLGAVRNGTGVPWGTPGATTQSASRPVCIVVNPAS